MGPNRVSLSSSFFKAGWIKIGGLCLEEAEGYVDAVGCDSTKSSQKWVFDGQRYVRRVLYQAPSRAHAVWFELWVCTKLLLSFSFLVANATLHDRIRKANDPSVSWCATFVAF